MTELKPCPFCGGEVIVYPNKDDRRAAMIGCINMGCYAMVSMCQSSVEETIFRWNRRS